MNHVRIRCVDGNPNTAKIELNGQVLADVTRVVFELHTNQLATVSITLICSDVEIEGDMAVYAGVSLPITYVVGKQTAGAS